MIEAVMLWNEPNNMSHWDFQMDTDWSAFCHMARLAGKAVKETSPDTRVIMGGISPIDSSFVQLLAWRGALDYCDVVAVHGFPLDWNHWQIQEWPTKIAEIEAVTNLPVWVTEVGVSTFGAEEVQVFGLQRTTELLLRRVERVFWYSLLDLPPAWEATTRHKEAEGSSYYRHFYLGLVRADGTPKPAMDHFNPELGICQWFHYQDHRLDEAVGWLKKLGIKKLRTGLSWADWHRPDSIAWFDEQMDALKDFDLTVTLCFTPPSRGQRDHYTSPPLVPEEFAAFSEWVVRRYHLGDRAGTCYPCMVIEPTETLIAEPMST